LVSSNPTVAEPAPFVQHNLEEVNSAAIQVGKQILRTFRCLELALYHSLGKLPEPESTHDFF
jgi:hypothetical protein